MRTSRRWTCWAVALLGLVWSVPTASAQFSLCRQVSQVVNVRTTFYGVVCDGIIYWNMSGMLVKSTTCTCQASICPDFSCAPTAKLCRPRWMATNVYCLPNH